MGELLGAGGKQMGSRSSAGMQGGKAREVRGGGGGEVRCES